jgi:hypothetical protein
LNDHTFGGEGGCFLRYLERTGLDSANDHDIWLKFAQMRTTDYGMDLRCGRLAQGEACAADRWDLTGSAIRAEIWRKLKVER